MLMMDWYYSMRALFSGWYGGWVLACSENALTRLPRSWSSSLMTCLYLLLTSNNYLYAISTVDSEPKNSDFEVFNSIIKSELKSLVKLSNCCFKIQF